MVLFKQIYLTRRGAITDYATLGQSRPGSNGNEWVLHTPQISRARIDNRCKCVIPRTPFLEMFYPSTGETISVYFTDKRHPKA